ncbi:hypothetical protein GWP85_16810 [Acinetobacter beijerinckii]|uniref:hypothetical protein n=1 Tax=Acinetobacter beijerinckii TaxID=262668 RepID=UPI0023DDFAAC|nr:hypothetical protein [Acinetobacter beijerinckii]MDF2419153.1 hypothetical protein [Acinetobacter beijerinckii]
MTADHHPAQVGIKMKNLNHLNPIYRCFSNFHLFIGGRSNVRKYWVIRLLGLQLPELKFNIELDFPFNPKNISKLRNRKYRRACYQSFMLYKKSFKPFRIARFRIIKNEMKWFKSSQPKLTHIADVYSDPNEQFQMLYTHRWLADSENIFFKGIIYHDPKF